MWVEVQERRATVHLFPSPVKKKKKKRKTTQRPAAMIHSTRHVANTFPPSSGEAASPSMTEFPIAVAHRQDKHAAFECTRTPVTACLIFSSSFAGVAPCWRCDWVNTQIEVREQTMFMEMLFNGGGERRPATVTAVRASHSRVCPWWSALDCSSIQLLEGADGGGAACLLWQTCFLQLINSVLRSRYNRKPAWTCLKTCSRTLLGWRPN